MRYSTADSLPQTMFHGILSFAHHTLIDTKDGPMTNHSRCAIALVFACVPSMLFAQSVSYRPPSTVKLVQHLIEQPGGALAVRKLTLEEAQYIALKNNKALTLARLNVLEKSYSVKAA